MVDQLEPLQNAFLEAAYTNWLNSNQGQTAYAQAMADPNGPEASMTQQFKQFMNNFIAMPETTPELKGYAQGVLTAIDTAPGRAALNNLINTTQPQQAMPVVAANQPPQGGPRRPTGGFVRA
jgi:hypothetical protein